MGKNEKMPRLIIYNLVENISKTLLLTLPIKNCLSQQFLVLFKTHIFKVEVVHIKRQQKLKQL